MFRCRICALVVLLAACGTAPDDADGDAGSGGVAGQGGASGRGGTGGGAGAGGAAAGSSAQGGAASGNGGAAASGGAGAGSAGKGAAGAMAGAGDGGRGAAGGDGSAGSAPLGGGGNDAGSGGAGSEGASAGSAGLGGAGGDPNEPSGCVNPLETVDVSRLVASEAFEPYVVTGDTANQIRQSIDQNRAMEYDAYTAYYLSWRFGDCAGNGLVVTVDLEYVYPAWEPSAGASAELVESWETYMDALFCHEYGHAKHGLDCANEVFTALSAIDAGGNCGAQQAQADAAFSAILADCNERDVQYDDETDHGATMGARFPP